MNAKTKKIVRIVCIILCAMMVVPTLMILFR